MAQLVNDLIGTILTYSSPKVTYTLLTLDSSISRHAYSPVVWNTKSYTETKALSEYVPRTELLTNIIGK